MTPFRFRPDQQDDVDGDGKTVEDWEDNAVSNFMAWGSSTFLPDWCQTEEHWTSRFANFLYTSCPCCMIWRGMFMGGSIVFWIMLIIFAGTRWL